MDRLMPHRKPERNSSSISRSCDYMRSILNSPSLDQLQKDSDDLAEKLANRLNLSADRREIFKVQGEASKKEVEYHIEHLKKIVEVDEKLGDLLKSKRNMTERAGYSVFDFIKQKINNEWDRKK